MDDLQISLIHILPISRIVSVITTIIIKIVK